MSEFVTLAIGWLLKKILDAVLAWAMGASRQLSKIAAYRLVKKSYLQELEHKAECLALLEQAFRDLPSDFKAVDHVQERASRWSH